jgi:acetylornithine deacetylase/succinyl-diaminopimelate desuccinylase-like protein
MQNKESADRDRLLESVEDAEEEIVALTQALVRLETVNTGVMPTGGETAACELLSRKLRGEGIDDVEVVARDPERGSLIARLPAQDARARLLLMSHSDVVPPGDERSWTKPPFGGVVENGRLYGRGASDMKGTVAAEAMALILLRRAGVPLRRTLSFLCAADEEAGGRWGAGWVAAEHGEKIRADYALNEGGGALVRIGDRLCSMLGLGEKGRYEVHFDLAGTACHAATPWRGENAFFALARLLASLERLDPPRSVAHPLFGALAPLVRGAFPDPLTPDTVDRFAAALEAVSPALGSTARGLSRMTVVPSLVTGGTKSNSVPDAARLTGDVRLLPGQGRADVERLLQPLLPEGASLRIDATAEPSQSPPDEPFMALLAESAQRVLGEPVTLLPGATVGFTDSHFVRPFGTTAYGCVLGDPKLAGLPRNAHGADEWTSIVDLIAATRFFVDVAWSLCVEGQ